VIRLPALFGPGLKKNALFDLMNDNCLDVINPESSFQWYDLTRLWSDITIAERNELRLVNLVTEPVAMRDILNRYFPGKVVGSRSGPVASYDLRTRYAKCFDADDGYIMDRTAVLDRIGQFVASAQGVQS
jgi:hypothetical protein